MDICRCDRCSPRGPWRAFIVVAAWLAVGLPLRSAHAEDTVQPPELLEKEADEALDRGLAWLARHQHADGRWSLSDYQECCAAGGQCSGPGNVKADAAATAMALLCFARAGHVRAAEGPYQEVARAGLNWLLGQQDPNDGCLAPGVSYTMYAHGLAAWALCEAYRVTGDKKLKEPAQRAVAFIESAQDPQGGGWRYVPRQAGDLSVTAWQVYALESARAGQLAVQDATWDGARRYLASVRQADRGDLYSYVPGAGASPSMTAHGLACRLVLEPNLDRESPAFVAGVSYLQGLLPDERTRNCYVALPFASVMAQIEGDESLGAKEKLARLLLETQEQAGCAAGSWHPREPVADTWGENGGRVMVTAFSLLTLEACRPQPAGQE
jgi:hypothetical protein